MENIEKAKNSVTELGKSIKNNIRVVKRKASQGFGNTAGAALPEYDKEEAVNAMISKIPSSPPVAASNLTLRDADMSSQVTLRGVGATAGTSTGSAVPPNIPSHLHAYFTNAMKSGPLTTAKELVAVSSQRAFSERDSGISSSVLAKTAHFTESVESDQAWNWKELFAELRAEEADKKLPKASDIRKDFEPPKQVTAKFTRPESGRATPIRNTPNGDIVTIS
ncbi:uncharacterized protein LOC129597131 [Paramacrobiotus metropolitanus]|uniref:uncharacterized protein LOC129597131 n=1 Tax=Paramacrobiotus metropolitanus TaxID=2943436 RepID=UPI00244590C5|nr:uncharacterized protein LOC129597131 [Paramacrobiotus metropolitanus]